MTIIGAAIVGAIIGFIIGAGAYFLLAPWLENQDGLLREMQGFAFNLVPGLTLLGGGVGAGVGAWWASRRRHP
jgi:prolipoprotein diacylglyceryltransferase